jgi:hypothetical protein
MLHVRSVAAGQRLLPLPNVRTPPSNSLESTTMPANEGQSDIPFTMTCFLPESFAPPAARVWSRDGQVKMTVHGVIQFAYGDYPEELPIAGRPVNPSMHTRETDNRAAYIQRGRPRLWPEDEDVVESSESEELQLIPPRKVHRRDTIIVSPHSAGSKSI